MVVSNLSPSCSSEEFLNAMKLRQLNTKLRQGIGLRSVKDVRVMVTMLQR